MKLEQQCATCQFKTRNARSMSNHQRFGCNGGLSSNFLHYHRHKDEVLKTHRKRRRAVKQEIFTRLGDKCCLCGFDNKFALQIDHVNGGGYAHRKRVGTSNYYNEILRLIRNGSLEFRLLCANCNQIQGVLLGHKPSIWN